MWDSTYTHLSEFCNYILGRIVTIIFANEEWLLLSFFITNGPTGTDHTHEMGGAWQNPRAGRRQCWTHPQTRPQKKHTLRATCRKFEAKTHIETRAGNTSYQSATWTEEIKKKLVFCLGIMSKMEKLIVSFLFLIVHILYSSKNKSRTWILFENFTKQSPKNFFEICSYCQNEYPIS